MQTEDTRDKIREAFASYFERWGITLPAEAANSRRPGQIASAGGDIRYVFGNNELGDYLEFYACHRMTNDRYERIYATGETEGLAAPIDWVSYPANASVEQKAEADANYRTYNQKVLEQLRAAGLLED